MSTANIPSRLTFIKQTRKGLGAYKDRKIQVRARALYLCECGVIKELDMACVNSGNTKSCGCLRKELRKVNPITKHNMSAHPLYSVWDGIKSRCYNKNHTGYSYYGGRGVEMCDEWRKDFKAFYEWAIDNGWRRGLQVDKDIKGTGLMYSPNDCLIVTPKQNSARRRINQKMN